MPQASRDTAVALLSDGPGSPQNSGQGLFLHPLENETNLQQNRQITAAAYPVLTLPNEIVSEIFIHFLPLYPKPPPLIGLLSPALLCEICHKWRNIGLTTPALWRAVGLSLDNITGRLAQQLSLLETYLKRSSASPFSFQLESILPSLAVPFLRTMSSHWDRCEHLALSLARDFPRGLKGPFPNLAIASFGDNNFPNPANLIAAFDVAPLLRKLALRFNHGHHLELLPWSKLTMMIFDWIVPQHCIYILSRTPYLVYCRFKHIVLVGAETTKGNTRLNDITLPHLETFVITHSSYEAPQSSFLDRLKLPALRSLHVSEGLLQPDPVGTLSSFVSRSQCNLQALWIGGAALSSAIYRTAVPSVPLFMVDGDININEEFFNEEQDIEFGSGDESESTADSGRDDDSGGEEESDGDEESNSDEDSDAQRDSEYVSSEED
ncbi:hypothetical protein DFH09DRAFT_1370338 [Mycena vulgaris]|nr:hypothetical protein DFH09DRAFT_1370338 [Mycena vulgaris]